MQKDFEIFTWGPKNQQSNGLRLASNYNINMKSLKAVALKRISFLSILMSMHFTSSDNTISAVTRRLTFSTQLVYWNPPEQRMRNKINRTLLLSIHGGLFCEWAPLEHIHRANTLDWWTFYKHATKARYLCERKCRWTFRSYDYVTAGRESFAAGALCERVLRDNFKRKWFYTNHKAGSHTYAFTEMHFVAC